MSQNEKFTKQNERAFLAITTYTTTTKQNERAFLTTTTYTTTTTTTTTLTTNNVHIWDWI